MCLPQWVSLLTPCVFALLIAFGIKHFYVWSQITERIGLDPVASVVASEPNALRYLLMWPVVAFSQATGVGMHDVFAWVVFALLVGAAVFSSRAAGYMRPAGRWDMALALWWWFGASFFMNGRLAFVFLGISLILYAQARFLRESMTLYRSLCLQGFGLLLCSVSSGCVLVVSMQLLAYLAGLSFRNRAPAPPARILLGAAVVATALVPLMLHLLAVNLAFYDGSVSRALTHGAGGLLLHMGLSEQAALLVCSVFILGVFLQILYRNAIFIRAGSSYGSPLLLAGFALIVGVFGYSALMTILLPLLLLVMEAIRKILGEVKQS